MNTSSRTTQLLWFVARTLPWLREAECASNQQIRQAFLAAQQRAFGSLGEAVASLEYSLGVGPTPARRKPAPSGVQRKILDALDIAPDRYDFYASYPTSASRGLFVFNHGKQISASCQVAPRIEGILRRHYHRTGRIPLRASSDSAVAASLRDARCPPLDLTGIDPFAARAFMAVQAIGEGQTRSLDWVLRSANCPETDLRLLQMHLADHPFPYVLPTHRVVGLDGSPVLGGLPLVDVDVMRRRENLNSKADLIARGGLYVVRPFSAEYCEVGCPRARVGERGAYLVADPATVCESLAPCAACRPLELPTLAADSRSA